MPNCTRQTFKHISRTGFLLAAILSATSACAEKPTVDLLAGGRNAWQSVDAGWTFDKEKISGTTSVLDGEKTDPAASAFMVSKAIFGGDVTVSMELTFDAGRYLGVYLDFDQETQTGIWMATGHALAENAANNEVERAYVKTVENSFWIVRATGELPVKRGVPLQLSFARKGDYYSVFNDDTLVVTFRKPGGYSPGPLQIRLTNASARIDRLEVAADRIDWPVHGQ